MNPIPKDFNIENLDEIKNLYAVLGQIRGEAFEFEKPIVAGEIFPVVWEYIQELQKANGLKVASNLTSETIEMINRLAFSDADDKATTTTTAATTATSTIYKVEGTVRDAAWKGRAGVQIEVFEQGLRAQITLLGAGETNEEGVYSIDYTVPIHPKTQVAKETVHLLVRATISEKEVENLTFYNGGAITQADFTAGDLPYQGLSLFEEKLELVTCALGDMELLGIEESGENQDVSFLYEETGLVKDDIMKLLLAHHISAALKDYALLTPALVYGFLYQDSPNNLPSYLLPVNLNDWEQWLESLVSELTKGLILSNTALQETVLKKSIRENIVPVQTALSYDESMEQLAQARKNYALQEALISDKIALNDLLVLTSMPEDLYETAALTFGQMPSFETGFLDRLASQEAVNEEHITELARAKTLAEITNYHLPLIQLMHNRISSKEEAFSNLQRLSDFAKWTSNDWLGFIQENNIELPADIYMESEDEKLTFYAEELYKKTVAVYPVVALVAQSSKSDLHQLSTLPQIAGFLDENQAFNLQTDHIDVFHKENPEGLTENMIAEIKVLKRINNISPSPEAGTVLLNQQIHSAGQVYSMGKAVLTNKLVDSGVSSLVVDQIYNLSANQYADALALASQYGFNQHNPKAIISLVEAVQNPTNPISSQTSGLPDLEALFGAMDYCECQHCKSVYSPAAYFTDILRFLDQKPHEGSSSVTIKDKLIDRRPDLDDIGLNCENAHKPLPYIDLVCEVLENALSTAAPGRNFAHDTTLSAEELRAFPQYVQAEAYELLAKESPVNNHFNLWLAETHLFLAHLGVPYHELMTTWQQGNIPDDAAIAAAYFEIYTNEAIWILNINGNGVSTSSVSELKVDSFLENFNLNYNQLLELLQLEWINSADSLTVIERPIDSCAIADQVLKNHITGTKLDRIHRFLRLWKHTDWELWELDLLIRNPKIGNEVLDANCLVQLQKFHQLQEQLRLSVEALIAFYEDLDITARRDHLNKEILPFYSRLFLNPAIDNPNFLNFEIPAISSSAGVIGQADSYTIAAVLGVDETVVTALLSVPTAATNDLELLSEIYRKTVLAKKLGLSVVDFNSLLVLARTGDPFASLDATALLLDNNEKLDTADLSIKEAHYLLTANVSDLGLSDDNIQTFLEQQRDAMLNLKDDLFNTAEPPKDLLKRHLAKLAVFIGNDNRLQEAIDLIFSEGKWTPPALVLLNPNNPPPVALSPQPFITTYFAFVRNNNTALTVLSDYADDSASSKSAKINYVLEELQYYFNRLLVQMEATENIGLSEDILQILLPLPNSTGTSLLTVLRNEDLIATANTIDYGTYPTQFEAYRLLYKMAFLVEKWKLDAAQLNDFVQHYSNTSLTILHLNALPIQSQSPAVINNNLFTELLNWSQFVLLNNSYRNNGLSIGQLWDNTTATTLLDDLAAWTNWDRTLLDELAVSSGLALNDFYAIETYLNLQSRIAQQKKLGVQVTLIQGWIQRDGTSGLTVDQTLSYQQEIANQIKKATKAKYEQKEWLKILKPIQDVLREKKRRALVQYFVLFRNFGTRPNDLFQYFLIDVEMSACQMTSRLKQAISSAQLFVQRILMNLEPTISIQNPVVDVENNWNQWKWMKNYRVWEANRKVFLYPENWIEPELRDDKSPFFEELESDLLQNEITHENVEAAFGRYLHKVDAVAHIDVMGMCEGLGASDEKLQHVLGRTKEVPGNYFFRSYNETYASWTAWEAVDVAITGNHAIPAVFNGKVYVFWLETLEKPSKSNKVPANKTSTAPTDAPENIPVTEMQLAWTVRKSDGWAPKKISNKKLIHPWPRPSFSFHLRPRLVTKPGVSIPSEHTPDVQPLPTTEFWIDLFVSDSREFNNKKFYDEYTGNFGKLANSKFSEAHRPWHSSSFVFDGGRVQSVKLLGLAGDYYLPEEIIQQSLPPVTGSTHLEVTSISRNSLGHFTIYTNQGGHYHFDRNNPSQSGIHQAINNSRPSYFPPLIIEDLYWFFWGTINIITNRGTTNTNNLLPLNNLIATGSSEHAPSSVTSNDNVIDITDSYIYVNNNFDADGRAIEPLGLDRTNDFDLVHGMKYAYNHITNNTGNLSTLPWMTYNYPLLNKALPPFKVVIPMKDATPTASSYPNSFYQDEKRAFFVKPEGLLHQFNPFYHPYTDMFISELNKSGTDGLLKRNLQLYPEAYHDTGYKFSDYNPDSWTAQSKGNTDIVDFSQDGAYASYNWEIFFHVPLMIATQLMNNQRFEEAMRWFHYIFDPTNTEVSATNTAPQKYWVTKPFYEFTSQEYHDQTINNILNDIPTFRQQVVAWKNNPFMPHLVARHRPVAYQRNVVMKYIDNLIAWGDQLFRRETIESLNQATLLYVLAHELLGDRPVEIANVPVTTKTYAELDAVPGNIDYFGNAQVLIAAEGLVASSNVTSPVSGQVPVFKTNYFCIPNNGKLAGYWDLVEDRLFKIRHCMNIDGVVRQLPLFAPPIDPALLVNAAAMGLDIGSVLDDLSVARSHYRYRALSRMASQFCSEVKSLGQSLLSALQSKDAEGMALLQSSNTLKILDATTQIKELQIEEAKENIESLKISKASTTVRKNFYESREFMNALEAKAMDLTKTSIGLDIASTVLGDIATGLAYIPNFVMGASGIASPVATFSFGGQQLSSSALSMASIASKVGGILQKEAGLASQSSSYKRRQEDWDLQLELASNELEQIEKQIAASQIRLAISEKDLKNHKLQIENTKSEEEYLKTKYTNQKLYSWMVSQTSTVYFQAYQLAFDMAKRAEKSFRYELALPTDSSSYIKFGYWDSLKKGLLSGDKLMLAINKMEAAYLEQNKRELELTKQISLRRLAPNSLLALVTTGECFIEIPEWWFDMDFPGHYLRRIKAMSVSIPCIVGPYTNVNCTLTLERNEVRHSATYTNYDDAENIHKDFSAIESVAISHGQNDSGLFELNFNDERYLPFEGAGAISRWKLKLSNVDMAQFDVASITDVVLHMRYMARNGGEQLRDDARVNLRDQLNAANAGNSQILLSLKQHFGTAWHRFIQESDHELDFKLDEKHFPYFTKFGNGREIEGGALLIRTKNESAKTVDFEIIPNNQTGFTGSGNPNNVFDNTLENQIKEFTLSSDDLEHPWLFKITGIDSLAGTGLQEAFDEIDDVILILNYKLDSI